MHHCSSWQDCIHLCIYKAKSVYKLGAKLWIYACVHMITNVPIFLKLWYCYKPLKLCGMVGTHGTRYHLRAISQAIPSKKRLFLPFPVWLFPSKSDTTLIISSLAYQLFGKRCNCWTERRRGRKGDGGGRREWWRWWGGIENAKTSVTSWKIASPLDGTSQATIKRCQDAAIVANQVSIY